MDILLWVVMIVVLLPVIVVYRIVTGDRDMPPTARYSDLTTQAVLALVVIGIMVFGYALFRAVLWDLT